MALFAGLLADRVGLTRAMVWTVPVPWILCALILTGFYFAYPGDSAKLRAMMAERAEDIETAAE